MARLLQSEFAAELNEKAKPPLSLSDIRDDPWFWGIGRPLAIAAVLAIFGIIAGVAFWPRYETSRVSGGPVYLPTPSSSDVQAEFIPMPESGPSQMPNPLSAEIVARIARVVIGELGPDENSNKGELRPIETITDAYRIERLKERMRVPFVSKKTYRESRRVRYQLVFIDQGGQIIASAAFYSLPERGYVLQPVKNAYERDGRYFIGGDAVLPGNWNSEVSYSAYAIPFPDWSDCIGYAPGA
jgi:hypothetical protein